MLESDIHDEIDTIDRLKKISSEKRGYISRKFDVARQQLNQRMAVTASAVEKIGIAPPIFTSVLTYPKIEKHIVNSEYTEVVIISAGILGAVYFMYMTSVFISQTLETYAETLKASLKKDD